MHCKRLWHLRATRSRKRGQLHRSGVPGVPASGRGKPPSSTTIVIRPRRRNACYRLGIAGRPKVSDRASEAGKWNAGFAWTARMDCRYKMTPGQYRRGIRLEDRASASRAMSLRSNFITTPGRRSPDTSASPSCSRRPSRTPRSSAPCRSRGTCPASADPPSPSSANTPDAGFRTRSDRSR
jgi:hypothetical protein